MTLLEFHRNIESLADSVAFEQCKMLKTMFSNHTLCRLDACATLAILPAMIDREWGLQIVKQMTQRAIEFEIENPELRKREGLPLLTWDTQIELCNYVRLHVGEYN